MTATERSPFVELARHSALELILTSILLFGVTTIVRFVVGPSPISRAFPQIPNSGTRRAGLAAAVAPCPLEESADDLDEPGVFGQDVIRAWQDRQLGTRKLPVQPDLFLERQEPVAIADHDQCRHVHRVEILISVIGRSREQGL